MENKIPTAEEFLKKNGVVGMTNLIAPLMAEYAKLHVKIALENAYDCHTFKGWTNSDDEKVQKELFVKNIMSRQSIK